MLRSLKYSALAIGLMGATQAMAGPDLTVVSLVVRTKRRR